MTYDTELGDYLRKANAATKAVRAAKKDLEKARQPMAILSTHLQGKSLAMRERAPIKIDAAMRKLMNNYQFFNLNGFFELVDEMICSMTFYLEHPERSGECKDYGPVKYQVSLIV